MVGEALGLGMGVSTKELNVGEAPSNEAEGVGLASTIEPALMPSDSEPLMMTTLANP
jgi:hypothetical protein